MPDSDVITRSLAQPEAFAAIFDRHYATIHRYLARQVGPQFAEDLASEVFTVAFARRGDYDTERRDALPWLYGIAANVLRSNRRARRQAQKLLARVFEVDASPPIDDAVDASLVAQARVRELGPFFARLSSREATILLLYAWEELTYEQIAEAMQMPVGTVRSRLNRIRARADKLVGASTSPLPNPNGDAEGGIR